MRLSVCENKFDYNLLNLTCDYFTVMHLSSEIEALDENLKIIISIMRWFMLTITLNSVIC